MAFTKWRPLIGANLDNVPERPGAYALGTNEGHIYYGMDGKSLKRRLTEHHNRTSHIGARIPRDCYFCHCETSTAAEAEALEADILAEFKREHGKLPALNTLAP
jgi:hypothetical protein